MRHARARRRPFETIGATVTALVLAAVPVAVVGTGTAAVAADTTLVSTDFSDGTLGGWTQSGGPTLSYVDVDGNQALQVADRTKDYDGIQTPAGLFADVEPGTVLTLSMRARLAPGTAGSAGRAARREARVRVGGQHHDDRRRLDDGDRHVHGARGRRPRRAAGLRRHRRPRRGPYTYLVDDLVITAPTAAATADDARVDRLHGRHARQTGRRAAARRCRWSTSRGTRRCRWPTARRTSTASRRPRGCSRTSSRGRS